MRSASSKTFWLLPSLALAFGALAWSAQHGPHASRLALAQVGLVPGAAVTYTYDPVGEGFFGMAPGSVVVGVDTVTAGAGRRAVCGTDTWSRGKPVSFTTYPCGMRGGRIQLRKVP